MRSEPFIELNDHWNDYSWSIMGVFREEDGTLTWADDSGCSCYGAWETPGGDRRPLTSETWDAFAAEVAGFPAGDEDKATFLSGVQEAMA